MFNKEENNQNQNNQKLGNKSQGKPKSEYLENEKSNLGEIESNFYNFKGFLLVKYKKQYRQPLNKIFFFLSGFSVTNS